MPVSAPTQLTDSSEARRRTLPPVATIRSARLHLLLLVPPQICFCSKRIGPDRDTAHDRGRATL